METSSDSAKPSSARRFGRWLLTIVALSLVSAVVDKALEQETRKKLRDLDDAFIAQLARIEPFHFAKIYYGYIVSGRLPERKPARRYVDFADEWRAHSAPVTPPASQNMLLNLLVGPFAVLFYTWTEGPLTFIVSIFALILGMIACWDTKTHLYGKILLIVITGSGIIWVLWAFASIVAAVLHPLIDWAAMITTVPFAGLLGKTIIEERQHHFVGTMVGKALKSPGEAH